MKKDLLVKQTAVYALIFLIACSTAQAQQVKCWGKENRFLERGISTSIGYLQVKKFCYCVEGFYGYIDVHAVKTQVPAPAYAYADPSNSSDWSTAEHRTSTRVDSVRCNAAGKWYATDQDYYRQDANTAEIAPMPAVTIEDTVETTVTVQEMTTSYEETTTRPPETTTTTETAPSSNGLIPSMPSMIGILLIVAGLGAVLLVFAAAAAYLYLKNKKKKAVVPPVTVEPEKPANAEYEIQKKKVQDIKDASIKTLNDYASYKIPLFSAKPKMSEHGDALAAEKEKLKKIADKLKIPYDPATDKPDLMTWALEKLKAGHYPEILVKDLSELGLDPGVIEKAEKSLKGTK